MRMSDTEITTRIIDVLEDMDADDLASVYEHMFDVKVTVEIEDDGGIFYNVKEL